MIQNLPGSIVCFDQSQINLYNKHKASQICLYISCCQDKRELVSTTINGKNIHFYEMCLKTNSSKDQLSFETHVLPLSCMLTTNPTDKMCLLQWLYHFFDASKNLSPFVNISASSKMCVICDISMPLVETLLFALKNQCLTRYANLCFKKCSQMTSNAEESIIFDTNLDNLNKDLIYSAHLAEDSSYENTELIIHTCTHQFMHEIGILCNYYYSQNYSFGMYAFSCLVNSQSLIELEKCLHAFMCILYSKTLNSIVETAFDYLKAKLNYYMAASNAQIAKNSNIAGKNVKTKSKNIKFAAKASHKEYYVFNNTEATKHFNQYNLLNDEATFDNLGLKALKRPNTESNSMSVQMEEHRLDKLSDKSLFSKMCELLFEKTKSLVDKCEAEEQAKLDDGTELPKNPRMSHELLFHFVRQFAATMPLWMSTECLNRQHSPFDHTVKRFILFQCDHFQ